MNFTAEGGGTEVSTGRFSVRVVARFWDFETGWRYAADLVRQEAKAVSVFNGSEVAVPRCVTFSEHDLA